MTVDIDTLGPVDWLVVEFPGSDFKGEIGPALSDLVDKGTVRVLDLLLLRKDADGALEAYEIGDLGECELGELHAYESELAMLLSEDDVEAVAAALEPGSTAACLVYENTWGPVRLGDAAGRWGAHRRRTDPRASAPGSEPGRWRRELTCH
jgi:hypothetical protein